MHCREHHHGTHERPWYGATTTAHAGVGLRFLSSWQQLPAVAIKLSRGMPTDVGKQNGSPRQHMLRWEDA